MKNDNIPVFSKLREELKEARMLQIRAATDEERDKASKLVKDLRRQLARLVYDHSEEERKVR